MATLRDVAERANVSVATVSHVINETKQVTPDVRSRVIQAAAALNYRRNHFARSLRLGASQTLGVVVPDLTNPFFPALIQEIESSARALGYTLLLLDSKMDRQNEIDALEILTERNVDGLLWVGATSDHLPTGALPRATVVVSSFYSGNVDTVHCDHREGARMQADALVEHGHRHVVLLSGPQTLDSSRKRRTAFVEAAKRRLEILWEHEVAYGLELPKGVVKSLVRRGFTAVVAANDTVAIAAQRAMLDAGIAVPEDVSVIGFDDIVWASLVDPPLTTIRQPVRELGAQAVAMLHHRIRNPDQPFRHETLPVELVRRRSLVPLRQAWEGDAP